jgi:NitT/TauT family transport system substrate-binding protein
MLFTGMKAKFLVAAVSATVGLTAIAGCTSANGGTTAAHGTKATSATVYLGFTADAVYAPAYVAQAMGYYRDAGLNITIEPGQGSTQALSVVTAGKAQFGFSDALTMAREDADGGHLRMLATVMPVAPAATAVLTDSPIKSIADLRGKTIGDSTYSTQYTLLPALLAQGGLTMNDVHFINMNFASRTPALLAGKIDATEGYATEYPNVASKTRLLLWRDYGLNYYAEGLYASDQFLSNKTNAATAKRFVQATMRGLQYTIDNPQAAARIVAQAAHATSPTFYEGEMTQLLPILQAHDPQGLGYMTAAKWQQTLDLVTKYMKPTGSTTLNDLYSNGYVK